MAPSELVKRAFVKKGTRFIAWSTLATISCWCVPAYATTSASSL
jgi:hypothetical protein